MAIDVRKIPIIGGTAAKIGQIYAISGTPCDPDPVLWFLAFWTGVPKAIYSIVKPSPVDYVQDRFGVQHHTKRKRAMKAAGQLELKINPGKGLGWAAFSASELADKIGWYLLVADVTADLVLNWVSTAYQWNGCQVPGSPYAHSEQTVSHPQATDGWQFTGVGGVASHIFTIGSAGITNVPPGYTYSCGASLTGTIVPGTYDAQLTATRIREVQTGKVIDEFQAIQFDDFTYTSTLQNVGNNAGNGATLYFECLFEGSNFGLSTSGDFWVSGAQGNYLLPDP